MLDETTTEEPEPQGHEQPATAAEEPVVEDLVIEDLSIDGMCGVY
jgi:mycofactocin precursor